MTVTQFDLWLLAGLLLMILLGAVVLSMRNSNRKRLGQRLQHVTHTSRARAQNDEESRSRGVKSTLATTLQSLGRMLPLFDSRQRQEMTRKLASAGYRRSTALAVLVGLSGLSALLTGFLIMTLGWPLLDAQNTLLRILFLLAGGYIGMMVPRLVLDRLVARRQRAIQANFPNVLDLLVVCTNAGLGLNAALQRVALEMEHIAPELADELTLTSGQLQLSGDVGEILREMADRIGLASIRSLVGTLIQSRRFGTPIGQALRVLSQSERTARLMRIEEAAAKLATKITLPMMFFILPTVLIIGAGPAILQLMEIFSNQ